MKKAILWIMLAAVISLPLSAQAGARAGRRRPTTFTLDITCNVPGATVKIEGEDKFYEEGQSDLTLNLNAGSYTIQVAAPNYITQTREIQLSANSTEAFTLQPATGRVVIHLTGQFLNMKHSNPRSQIQVYDNGTLLEGNGFQYDLRPGQHTIQIVSGGFMVQDTIQVEAGKTYRLEPVFRLELR